MCIVHKLWLLWCTLVICVHGMQVHCCLPCAPRVYSIRIGYCILVFTILPVL